MNLAYALYDALLGINVPPDKARAVIDAMERDMGTVLATRVDLDHHYLLLKQEIASAAALTSRDIGALDVRLEQAEQRLGVRIDQVDERLGARIDQVEERFGGRIDQVEAKLDARIDQLEVKLDARFGQVDARIDLLRSSMTVRLGSMMFVAVGLLFAALRLT